MAEPHSSALKSEVSWLLSVTLTLVDDKSIWIREVSLVNSHTSVVLCGRVDDCEPSRLWEGCFRWRLSVFFSKTPYLEKFYL